ncbi:Sec-independent protein translocase subunit TatA [Corynebacterium sp. P3-F1]|uniref:Sec-independent protein translocase subunit TatA n=1 Tax=Corynebacterium sp. P3-F1 TaxID=3059080 RepID=UPI00265CE57C|nr:Sec-independent protein translocase subunit TatA [Corynebacterium sp. P3-F1]WKK61533.1 Sec-independent protein translocase subunit TatA [Corynebacterium sp. P3-F1]
MPSLGPMEILLIVFVVLLLFGSAKLPELARSVGRSARIFKSEVNEMQNDGKQQGATAANVEQDAPQTQTQPQREITSGPTTQGQQSVDQGFWNQSQNQQPNQPGTNPNA